MLQSLPVAKEVVFLPAKRRQTSLTAKLERRALSWMAERVPSWLSSDHLTCLGLMAQIGAGAAYATARSYPAALLFVNVCLVLNWWGDSLDGTLARFRGTERPRYGFYVDHIADVLGSVAMFGGLAFSESMHPAVAAAALVAFLVLASESYLATYTLGRFELSQGIFGPTELRLLLIAGNFALLRSRYATIFGRRWLLFDMGGTTAAACMGAMALWLAARHTAELYRKEPLR